MIRAHGDPNFCPRSTPWTSYTDVSWRRPSEIAVNGTHYHCLVGGLRFLFDTTHSLLAYYAQMLSLAFQDPCERHQTSGRAVLAYLHAHVYDGLEYHRHTNDQLYILAYRDSDYA